MPERRVVIVDDENFLQMMMKKQIERDPELSQYPLVQCRNGAEFLQFIAENRTLVEAGQMVCLLDLYMPGVDGLGVIRNLVSQGMIGVLRNIALFTGNMQFLEATSNSDIKQLQQQGVFGDVLDKTSRPETVLGTLKRLAAN
jgi:CheY-like chemotaxis protein